MTTCRITANNGGESLTLPIGSVTASVASRTISGMLVKYNVVGHTSKGPLKVAPGALRFPDDLSRVKLTKEHDRSTVRGHMIAMEYVPDGIRASFKVADGPDGDEALREAQDKTRDGLSYDAINAVIQGDFIVSGDVIAGGQVGIPAYSGLHIDSIAASQTPAAPNNPGEKMTPEQVARLAALRAQSTRNAEEEAELSTLAALETPAQPAAPAAPAPAAAAPAAPAVPAPQIAPIAAGPAAAPSGVPVAASFAEVNETGLDTFAQLVASAMMPGGSSNAEITAALADVTHAQHTDNVSPESWSGELWSGLEYEPQFMDLFNHGDLTSWAGKGWRWGTKPQVGAYAGNKADIPTNTPTTVPSTYEAFRIAGGWDFDRKFFDFPDAAFIASFLAAVREHYAMTLDFKVRDYIIAEAAASGFASQTSLLKAVRLATKKVKRNTRAKATFILVNDDDMDSLFDITNDEVSAFLNLLDVQPENIRSTPDIAAGLVYAGVKQAATVRELPGASPIRVEAQNLTKAGIDEAFFGYGAIEEHHTTGIVKQAFDETP